MMNGADSSRKKSPEERKLTETAAFKGWSKARIEAFEERAAIMEYDGGMERKEAERAAFKLLRPV